MLVPVSSASETLDLQGRVNEQLRFADLMECPGVLVFTVQGNGGSWLKIFEEWYPTTNMVVVRASWSLMTNNAVAGADGWAMGIQVIRTPAYDVANGRTLEWVEDTLESGYLLSTYQSGYCETVWMLPGDYRDSMDLYYDAGAYSWMSQTSCTTTTSWEYHAGVSVGIHDASTTHELVLGGAYACSDGALYDSESLLKGRALVSGVCLGCIIEPMHHFSLEHVVRVG